MSSPCLAAGASASRLLLAASATKLDRTAQRLDPPRCPTPPAAGLCNSTANQAAVAQLEAQLAAQAGSDVTIYCVDTPITGRRLLATQAAVTGSACGPVKNLALPPGVEQTGESADGCVPAVAPAQASPVSAPAAPQGRGRTCTPERELGTSACGLSLRAAPRFLGLGLRLGLQLRAHVQRHALEMW